MLIDCTGIPPGARRDFLCVQRKLFKEEVILDIFACMLCGSILSAAGKRYFRNKYFKLVKLVPFQCVDSSGGKYKDVWRSMD